MNTEDPILNLPRSQFDALMEAAAERAGEIAAQRVLKTIGLDDEHAIRDVRELRTWVASCRKIRDSMLASIGKVVIFVAVAALAVLFGKNYMGGAH